MYIIFSKTYLFPQAFSANFGGREDAARFAVMILDNRSDNRQTTLDAAKKAQGLMDIFVIGVGEYVNKYHLYPLCSLGYKWVYMMFMFTCRPTWNRHDSCQSVAGQVAARI